MALVDFELKDVGNIFTSLREAIIGEKITDPVQIAEINYKVDQLEQLARDGQIAINKIEAKSSSVFIGGWRPFIGWVGGSAIAYTYIIQPLFTWLLNIYIVFGDRMLTSAQAEALTPLTLDTGLLFNLVLAMLGFGGLRTFEKLKNIDTRTKGS